jgi:hypothetical protein
MNSESNGRKIPIGMIGQIDQLTAAVDTMAQILGSYFTALMREGFEREDAMMLVMMYHEMLLDLSIQKSNGG